MGIKNKLKKIRDTYVINQVQRLHLPEFTSEDIQRYRIIFSGRVQKVGFRLEVSELAKRLELTGFCENLKNRDVLAELQGPDERIQYLVSFMESLKRIKITGKVMEKLEINRHEAGFIRR